MERRMKTNLRVAAYLLGLLCVVSATNGCSGERPFSGHAGAPTSVTSSASPQPSGNLAPQQPLSEAGIVRKTRKPDPGALAVSLTNITVSNQGDHDEAVFEF